MGKEQRNALRSWTTRIIEHLLLLEHSAGTFRSDIEPRLTPTLRSDLHRQMPRLYELMLRHIGKKLEVHGEAAALVDLPQRSPYTLDQILGPWWPEISVANGYSQSGGLARCQSL